jgi:hypothetical protein
MSAERRVPSSAVGAIFREIVTIPAVPNAHRSSFIVHRSVFAIHHSSLSAHHSSFSTYRFR